MSPSQLELLNCFQHAFPLVPRPFGEVGRRLGRSERWVLDTLAGLQAHGTVSRVGAVFAPNTVGASTLAALSVPPSRLAEVAARVSAHPAVTHNYARDHARNLWFVVTAADEASLAISLAAIEEVARCGPLLDLRLEEEYHIDLGFDLASPSAPKKEIVVRRRPERIALSAVDRLLVDALAEGLPLVSAPFEKLGAALGLEESATLGRVEQWSRQGTIRRFGIVVRHAELGFGANAMAVWDVPDAQVTSLGETLARVPGVTLCYRRRTAPPDWTYNLFCMVHGASPAPVRTLLDTAARLCGLDRYPGAVLPTLARFKQRGATHWRPREVAHA